MSVLWALSGRQFGACEVTVRPCPQRFGALWGPFPYMLTRTDGHWLNWPCGCIGSCQVSGPRVIHLPGPVAPPTTDDQLVVEVDGVVLNDDEYTLEGDVLYRIGGVWPVQDLGRPLGEDNTWSVTYRRGVPVPSGVPKLVGQLAREFLAACSGDEDACRLPSTLVSLNRRGVSMSFDPARILEAGYTGLREIDQWLASVNPHRLQEAASVL